MAPSEGPRDGQRRNTLSRASVGEGRRRILLVISKIRTQHYYQQHRIISLMWGLAEKADNWSRRQKRGHKEGIDWCGCCYCT